jgi:hypothetical protein
LRHSFTLAPAYAGVFSNGGETRMNVNNNDRLPETYRNFPYQYTRLSFGTVLRKNNDEVYLFGDDETVFFRDCSKAKQQNRSLSDVIEEYFIN